MEEIIVKNNITGLRVFINGMPDTKLIPKDEVDCFITALELQIAEHYSKKNSGTNKKE